MMENNTPEKKQKRPRLILNGTKSGFERLKAMDLKELSKKLGVEVTSIDWLGGEQ
jgi:hypothetical protein